MILVDQYRNRDTRRGWLRVAGAVFVTFLIGQFWPANFCRTAITGATPGSIPHWLVLPYRLIPKRV